MKRIVQNVEQNYGRMVWTIGRNILSLSKGNVNLIKKGVIIELLTIYA
jgi:hypothetical protein